MRHDGKENNKTWKVEEEKNDKEGGGGQRRLKKVEKRQAKTSKRK